jgi:hypothetical protein
MAENVVLSGVVVVVATAATVSLVGVVVLGGLKVIIRIVGKVVDVEVVAMQGAASGEIPSE